jgi:adenosyl cobinamide kinase/adenosyl cobinamide phosphate guanylyltransferase
VITLVLGGARSGKSAVAEAIAAGFTAPVTYVATLEIGDDAELAARVDHHRGRRPAGWRTVEAGHDLAGAVRGLRGTVLVDSLGPWVSSSPDMEVDADELCDVLARRDGDAVVVSEEVGLSVHPSTAAGRRFQDVLGLVNQQVASHADEVLLVVAGRRLRLAGPEG